MQFTLSKSLEVVPLAPFCTIFAFCGAKWGSPTGYMPAPQYRLPTSFAARVETKRRYLNGAFTPIFDFV
jgi:hypothetical protein